MHGFSLRSASVLMSMLILAPGCRQAPPWNENQVALDVVRLDTEHLKLRHDQVGHDRWASQATFVLIDAHNTHTKDLMVTLNGDLVGDQGQVVGTLSAASLRVPAGGVRMFALVDNAQTMRAQATSARIRVVGAHVPNYAPPVQITDGNVYRDGDRVVVNATVHNTAARPVRVLIIGGFYDAQNVPMKRPFTDMYLPGSGSHSAQFVGPPGSTKGYIFVGDLAY